MFGIFERNLSLVSDWYTKMIFRQSLCASVDFAPRFCVHKISSYCYLS